MNTPNSFCTGPDNRGHFGAYGGRFVAEPLIVRRRFSRWATTHPRVAFAWLYRAHWVLLTLGLVTILGAVAGSHGWSIF